MQGVADEFRPVVDPQPGRGAVAGHEFGEQAHDAGSGRLAAGSEKSTSSPSSSRFQSSTTFRVRKRRPSVSASLLKSSDQHRLGAAGCSSGRLTHSGSRRQAKG